VQDSAAPYHDWNDRITAECYAPNGASRITNRKNEIIRIVNNYSRMSFNFGPTLLSWLADKAPRTYRMILDADAASMQRFGGHGSAIAQVYNHVILPLATRRDALTQIRWGIADFEHRFHRRPEGMWLAETAVNREVLDLMASEGIRFTILAPNQCARVRPITGSPARSEEHTAEQNGAAPAGERAEPGPWAETPSATVDTTHPYLVHLEEGRSIVVFFYNGPVSRAIAFEGLLNSGEDYARRLLDIARHAPETGRGTLAHVATDGESYGHHHKHGEMALSYAMHWLEQNDLARLTNYGEFLELCPPEWEAEIAENTSWSCAHGVERWRSNCGCNGGKPGCNQEWRGPLRDALNLVRDGMAPLAEKLAASLLKDIWAAQDAYIAVVLDRSHHSVDRFLEAHAVRELDADERMTVLELMEMLRQTQLMYTSCGWFFDEISGIETVQIMAYAGRALQLAGKLFGAQGETLEERFMAALSQAKSNVPELGDGAEIYRRYVLPLRIGLEQVGAHYAISSVFRAYPDSGQLFCYELDRIAHESFNSGRGRVALGRAAVRSRITGESEEICYAVLHFGDQNLSAAVRPYNAADQADVTGFAELSTEIRSAIRRANLPEVIRLIDRLFGTLAYSLTSLFSDEQHRILRAILDRTLGEMEDSLRKIYEDHASLLRYLTESGMAAPPALALAANFALNASLRRAMEAEPFSPGEVSNLLARAAADQVTLDPQTLSFAAGQRMKTAMVKLEARVDSGRDSEQALQEALTIARCLRTVPFETNLWQAQNIWNDLFRRDGKEYWLPEWKEGFQMLGEALNICVADLVTDEGGVLTQLSSCILDRFQIALRSFPGVVTPRAAVDGIRTLLGRDVEWSDLDEGGVESRATAHVGEDFSGQRIYV
jgi:alpha-amylase/alpha-mannosidase (GH57 family)